MDVNLFWGVQSDRLGAHVDCYRLPLLRLEAIFPSILLTRQPPRLRIGLFTWPSKLQIGRVTSVYFVDTAFSVTLMASVMFWMEKLWKLQTWLPIHRWLTNTKTKTNTETIDEVMKIMNHVQDTLVIGRAGKVLRLVRVMRILRVFKVENIIIIIIITIIITITIITISIVVVTIAPT